jgi:hypothetical protein
VNVAQLKQSLNKIPRDLDDAVVIIVTEDIPKAQLLAFTGHFRLPESNQIVIVLGSPEAAKNLNLLPPNDGK